MGFSKLLNEYVKVETWISLSCYMDFKACWSICFELKLLNESKFSMPWVLCAFGNVSRLIMRPKFLDYDISIARTLRVINFTFAFNLEICETHASLNITIDLWKCTAYFGRTIIPPLRERRNVNFVPRKLRLLEETRRVSKSTWSSIPSHGRSSCRSRRRRTRWRWWRTRDLLMRKWTGSPWSRWN